MKLVPINPNPNEELLNDFMNKYHFTIERDVCSFNILLIDHIGEKIYAIPMSIKGDKQLASEIMCLLVELRNIKETWGKEKDSHKRRKIYSKMNYIKGELNQYAVS